MSPAVCLALFATTPLGSERGTAPVIAVVSPAQTDRAMSEALNRFRGEAAAVGFAVTIVSGSRGGPSAQMEAAARAVPGVATVAFVRGGDPTYLDVWFTDRMDGQTVVDHVSVESNRADRAVVLAVKAVDVLRARMFGLLARRGRTPTGLRADSSVPSTGAAAAPGGAVEEASAVAREAGAARPLAPTPARTSPGRDQAASPVATPPSALTENRPASVVEGARAGDGAIDETRMGVALGVAALRNLPGLSTSYLMVLRGEHDVGRTGSIRLTLGGIGTRPVVVGPAGRAVTRDTLLMLEGGMRPWGRRVRPLLALSAGFHYFSVDGTPTLATDMQAYKVSTVDRLVGAAGVSLGVRLSLTRHLAACVDTGAQILFPQVQVAVSGLNPQQGGRPTLMGTFTLEGRI